MATSVYKSLIVGGGQIAANHVKADAAQGGAVETVAVVDIDAARAERFAKENGLPRWYTDLGEALAKEKPFFAHVCTPPGAHAKLSIAVMEGGAHAYTEKPICTSLAELDQVQAAEQRTGRRCVSVFQFRLAPSNLKVRGAIEAGTFGRPLVGVCNTLWYRDPAYYEVPWRGKWATEAGGPTMGHGIHAMDHLLSLLGPWREVRAVVANLDRAIEVEDLSAAVVSFENGAVATVVNSILSPRQETYIRLDFQRATVELTHLYDFSGKEWKVTAAPKLSTPEIEAFAAALPDDSTARHGDQIRALLEDLRAGREHLTGGPHARQTLELLTAIYKSGFTGRPVSAGEIKAGDPFYASLHGGYARVEPYAGAARRA